MTATRSKTHLLLGISVLLWASLPQASRSEPVVDAPVVQLAPMVELAANTKSDAPSSPVRLFVTLTWEGRTLDEHNLVALRAFRERFSDIQFMHLLSPAYFARAGADTARVKAAVRSVMRPKDKIGIAVGAWKSIVDRAGVIFRGGPTFWGKDLRAVDCAAPRDCGVDVPLNVYPQQEVAQITKAGLDVLQANGFGRPLAVQATGWVASPQVLEAFVQNGMRYDFSAVAPELLARRLSGFPLYQWVRTIWTTVTPHTQPFVLPSVSTSLTEIPQSIAAVDYLLEDDVVAIFKEYAERLRREPNRDLTFQIGVYQETARQTLPALGKALQAIFAHAAKSRISLQPFDVAGLDVPADTSTPPVSPSMPIAH